METYSLVVSIWIAGWLYGGHWQEETREQGWSELGCWMMAAEVKPPKQAKCVREDAPPRMPLVVCGYFGGCWQVGSMRPWP